MRKFILSFFALLFCATSSIGVGFAQIKFEASAPLSVTAGERFRVEFTLVNGKGSNFVNPSVTNADVLAGPSVADGSQTTIINGQQSTTTYQTYTFILIANSKDAVKVGTSTVLANGKSYSTKPLTIDVNGGGSGSNKSGSAQSQAGFSATDVLLKTEISKTDVYKGEAIVATLKLYTRVPITGVEDAKYAKFNGFWTQEVQFDNQQIARATIGGKAYTSQVVRQWLIFPQKSGVLEVEQNEFTIVAQVTVPSSGGGSIYDDFFGGMDRTEMIKRKIVAPPVKVNVKELPKPEPDNFSGAVGKFTMETSISANELTANSAGNITIKIAGSGNFPLITNPELVLPAAFEKYDVKLNDQVKYSAAGASGTKTLEYPFIARAEGEYKIDPIVFSYFDIASKTYKTLSSGDFNIKITKGDGSKASAGAFISGVTKEDLKMLGQDIRFIKVGDPKLKKMDDKLLWSFEFFVAIGVIIIAFIVIMALLSKIIKQGEDVAKVKNKKANKVAIRRLKRANTYMHSSDKDKFYEEMLRALWGYIGDKLAIEVADLTKERVLNTLVNRGVEQSQAENFLNIISRCEYAQYSPSEDSNMNNIYEEALEIIGNMEVK